MATRRPALDRVLVEDVDQRAAVAWIEHALHEQMMHLSVGWEGQGEQRLSFTAMSDDADHPRGLQVHVHGGPQSTWYRIRHDRICLICREIRNHPRIRRCDALAVFPTRCSGPTTNLPNREEGIERKWKERRTGELGDGTRIWISTETDRSVTTILLPEDY